jgi:hypothetical protein
MEGVEADLVATGTNDNVEHGDLMERKNRLSVAQYLQNVNLVAGRMATGGRLIARFR